MKNYKILNTCANCDHSFVKCEYDEGDTYYCLLKNPTQIRPKCGSIAMNESFFGKSLGTQIRKTDEEINKEIDAWDTWAEENFVYECGTCDNWTKKLLKAKTENSTKQWTTLYQLKTMLEQEGSK